jgi:hypothetical protein
MVLNCVGWCFIEGRLHALTIDKIAPFVLPSSRGRIGVFALPSPTVFRRNRRSEGAKTGPLPQAEVIEEGKFPHNTAKIGLPKNKLPLPTPFGALAPYSRKHRQALFTLGYWPSKR